MDIISKDQFIYEKQIISNLLKDTRLLEITYTDAFHLLFYKTINVSKTDSDEWITEKWMLMLGEQYKNVYDEELRELIGEVINDN